MEVQELLKEEIVLLNDLSKDSSFDLTVIQDAKSIIDIKNRKIVDLGGTPIVFDVKESVGVTDEELIEKLRAKLAAFYMIKSKSETANNKFNAFNRVFKSKTGITYEQFREAGNKFVYGGVLNSSMNFVLTNLSEINEFSYIKKANEDAILKYTTPENSILYSVILPKGNIAYALVYLVGKNKVIDFYQDEQLRKSLNYTYSFVDNNGQESFQNKYLEMINQLSDVETKNYM